LQVSEIATPLVGTEVDVYIGGLLKWISQK